MKPIDLWRRWNRVALDAEKAKDRIREAYARGFLNALELVYPKTLGRTPRLPEDSLCEKTQTTSAER